MDHTIRTSNRRHQDVEPSPHHTLLAFSVTDRPQGLSRIVSAVLTGVAVLPSLGREADRNSPWLGFLGFRQRQGEHPIIELGTDTLLVDLVGQSEGSRIVTYVVLRIDC